MLKINSIFYIIYSRSLIQRKFSTPYIQYNIICTVFLKSLCVVLNVHISARTYAFLLRKKKVVLIYNDNNCVLN